MRSRSAGPIAALLCNYGSHRGRAPPGMLVMHSCGGITDSHRAWAGRLVGWGYAALIVDSFGPRNQRHTCNCDNCIPARVRARTPTTPATYLRTLPDIQPRPDSDHWLLSRWLDNPSAAVSAKKSCRPRRPPVSGGSRLLPHMLRQSIAGPYVTDVLNKHLDPGNCIKTVAARAKDPHPPAIKVYPGAVHGFDIGGLPSGHHLPATWRQCRSGGRTPT